VLAVPDAAAFVRTAEAAGVPAVRIGTSGGQDLTLPDGGTISVRALRAAHERFFPSWMDG
jgi:phosphoribosylformylglycinamidine synthase subunit PurL